jgi:hypothetical protein
MAASCLERARNKELALRSSNLALLVLPLFLLSVLGVGCYKGYAIKPDELGKVQSGSESRSVKVVSSETDDLEVTDGTTIQITDRDGLTYPLQPFNFKLTATQLVAPEQDLVLPIGTIDRVEVRKLNTLGTVGLFALGVAAAAGIVIGIAATAGEDTGF